MATSTAALAQANRYNIAQANRLLAAEANIAWDGAATPPLPPLMAHFLRTEGVLFGGEMCTTAIAGAEAGARVLSLRDARDARDAAFPCVCHTGLQPQASRAQAGLVLLLTRSSLALDRPRHGWSSGSANSPAGCAPGQG